MRYKTFSRGEILKRDALDQVRRYAAAEFRSTIVIEAGTANGGTDRPEPGNT